MDIKNGTKLQINIEGSPRKYESELIGQKRNEYLIIKMPENVLCMGHKVVVKFIKEGTVYIFHTSVLASVFDPEILIFLNSPTSVEDMSIRGHRRKLCCLPADVKSGVNSFPGVFADLSEKGALIIIDKSNTNVRSDIFKVGKQIICSIMFPGKSGDFKVDAFVRNLSENSNAVKIGVEFSILTDLLTDNIKAYLSLTEILIKI